MEGGQHQDSRLSRRSYWPVSGSQRKTPPLRRVTGLLDSIGVAWSGLVGRFQLRDRFPDQRGGQLPTPCPCGPFTLRDSGALAAAPSAAGIHISILRRILVPTRAMSFRGRFCANPARRSQSVDAVGNWLEVGGIHASPVLTQMIQLQAVRNGADKQLVGDAVRPRVINWISGARVEVPITRSLPRSPKPTPARSVLINLRPEPLFERNHICAVARDPTMGFTSNVPEFPAGPLVPPSHLLTTAALAEG